MTRPLEECVAFVKAQTVLAEVPEVPGLLLHLVDTFVPLWEVSEEYLQQQNVAPPYWAFAWPGGRAVARYLVEQPATVAGARVVDFAAGSGLCGLTAVRCGASEVIANDIDPLALAAVFLNARQNNLAIGTTSEQLVGQMLKGVDVVLAGDVCYESLASSRFIPWFRALAGAGTTVLLGDPGRRFLPATGLEQLARYTLETSTEIESCARMEAGVWRVLAGE